MHRTLRQLILTCQLLLTGHSMAQAPAAPEAAPAPAAAPLPEGATAPLRSVAVLVDVSGSVYAPWAVEARDIIGDILSGRGFKPGTGWVTNDESPEALTAKDEDVWPDDPALRAIFSRYWLGSAQPQKPLTGPGKAFFLGSIGILDTTLDPPRMYDTGSIQDVEALLKQEYPNQPKQFKDGMTNYYIGVSRTAERLLARSDEGCYLFVVSDEWDDPEADNKRKELNSYMPVLKKHGIYDPFFQSKMVAYFNELKSSNRFHLIARFHKGNRPRKNTSPPKGEHYLRVAWYAIGEKPQAVQPLPLPVVQKEGDPPPPPTPVPPTFERSLTLLGGLIPANDPTDTVKPDDARIKVFDQPNPFITWQVDGVSASSVDSQFEVTITRLGEGRSMESFGHLIPAQLSKTSEGRLRGLPVGVSVRDVPNGIYRVTVEEKPLAGTTPPGGKTLGPVATWIEVKTPFNWVPWMLGISVLGAAGVIGYSVWTLRR